MSAAPASPPPEGWYRDPSGVAELRYWNGVAWSDGVSNKGIVSEAPLPPPHLAPNRDRRAVVPTRATLVGLLGLVAGAIAATVLGLAGHALGLSRLVLLPIVQTALWTGMVGACIVVSRRYGTGSVRTDFGLHVRGMDLVRGLVASLLVRAAAALVIAIFLIVHTRVESNVNVRESFRHGGGLVEFAVIAVIGAPLVEELFFRGLLLQAFRSRLHVVGAVAAQGALFGLVHVNPVLGAANVPLVVALATVGMLFGLLAVRYRRLGPSMAAHAWFNVVVVIAVAVG